MTQAVFRSRHTSQGRFFRLRRCLARPKLLRIRNLRGVLERASAAALWASILNVG